jgi:hypothetical protein
MMYCFKEPLEAAGEVVLHLLNEAVELDVVVMVGGFSDSPALRTHLKKVIRDWEQDKEKASGDRSPITLNHAEQ